VLVDLVKATTRDGVQLDGMFQAASSPAALGLDAVCFVHGTGGNFYSSTLFSELAQYFLSQGCGVLRVNTRGHDGISTAVTACGGRRLGAAYETVDDCRHDVAAWLEWLRQHAGPRSALLGHSLGAVKAIYAVTQQPTLAPGRLLALSPPRLSYRTFCTGAQRTQFLDCYERAEQAVERGQPATLLEVQVPLPMAITAAGYLEKYGPAERYNFVPLLSGLTCPTWITLGGNEVQSNMAFQGLPEDLQLVSAQRQSVQVAVIPEADHFYTGVRTALVDRIDRWLRG
jgi:pimeloyl-ACP methyl ester carboxylesterase